MGNNCRMGDNGREEVVERWEESSFSATPSTLQGTKTMNKNPCLQQASCSTGRTITSLNFPNVSLQFTNSELSCGNPPDGTTVAMTVQMHDDILVSPPPPPPAPTLHTVKPDSRHPSNRNCNREQRHPT